MRCAACGVENPAGQQVLSRVRRWPGAPVPALRDRSSFACAVLQRVRHDTCGTVVDARWTHPSASSALGGRGEPHHRTSAVLGAVRRPRRLHAARRETGPRGDQRAALALLRACPGHRRPLRRDRREVHRRRRHGGVGGAGRERGRRRAGRPGRPRHRGIGRRARRSSPASSLPPGRASSPARSRSRSARWPRAWCSATRSTPPRGSRASPRPVPCSSTRPPGAPPRARSPSARSESFT